MKGKISFKSKIIPTQKHLKHDIRVGSARYRIDLMKLRVSVTATKTRSEEIRSRWIKGLILAFIASLSFFLLGYLIVGLPIPIWLKVMCFAIIATLGVALSYFMATLLNSH